LTTKGSAFRADADEDTTHVCASCGTAVFAARNVRRRVGCPPPGFMQVE
jgi:hypothetical protein